MEDKKKVDVFRKELAKIGITMDRLERDYAAKVRSGRIKMDKPPTWNNPYGPFYEEIQLAHKKLTVMRKSLVAYLRGWAKTWEKFRWLLQIREAEIDTLKGRLREAREEIRGVRREKRVLRLKLEKEQAARIMAEIKRGHIEKEYEQFKEGVEKQGEK